MRHCIESLKSWWLDVSWCSALYMTRSFKVTRTCYKRQPDLWMTLSVSLCLPALTLHQPNLLNMSAIRAYVPTPLLHLPVTTRAYVPTPLLHLSPSVCLPALRLHQPNLLKMSAMRAYFPTPLLHLLVTGEFMCLHLAYTYLLPWKLMCLHLSHSVCLWILNTYK